MPGIGTFEDLLFRQPVPLYLIVIPAYPAVIAVIFTVIGKFDETPDIDLGPVPLPAHLIGGFRQGVVILTVNKQPQPLIAQTLSFPKLFNKS
jgi:hypothetical protein